MAPFIFYEFVIKSCKTLLDWDMTKFASSFLPAFFWMLACTKSSMSVLTFLDTIKSQTSRLLSFLTFGGFASFARAFVLSALLPVGIYTFFCFRRAYLLEICMIWTFIDVLINFGDVFKCSIIGCSWFWKVNTNPIPFSQVWFNWVPLLWARLFDWNMIGLPTGILILL